MDNVVVIKKDDYKKIIAYMDYLQRYNIELLEEIEKRLAIPGFHKQKIHLKENTPIKLTPVKTLTEWFANLPLIYKLDLYNSYSDVITKYLKMR